jgi:hypothetical protein
VKVIKMTICYASHEQTQQRGRDGGRKDAHGMRTERHLALSRSAAFQRDPGKLITRRRLACRTFDVLLFIYAASACQTAHIYSFV